MHPKHPLPTIWLCLLMAGILILPSESLPAQDDLTTVRARYLQWLLGGSQTDYANPAVRERCRGLIRSAAQAKQAADTIDWDQPLGLYDTRATGQERRELFQLVTEVLPDLSLAYQLPPAADVPNPFYRDPAILDILIDTFDRLDQRGFRHDMQMPWHANQAEETDPPTAVIANFHLRTAGYALAAMLLRDELDDAGRLERTLRTCRAVSEHGEKTGDLTAMKLNADGVRVAINFALPLALAASDPDRLEHLARQMDRSMAVESDASDTIKPDGLGYHHRGVYLAGYAPYAVSQTAFMAWLLDDTRFELAQETIDNLRKSLLILRVVSQKYDMHKALAGRLRGTAVIPDVMLGYAYLAAVDGAGDARMARALARLCDEAFLESTQVNRAFGGHRDEVPPGPGAVDFLFKTLDLANRHGPEPEPNGHWALNYGPLSVHRRDDWMVSVKGFSKYLWSFERSITDALGEERRQNVLGLHDSSCTIRIHALGNPVNSLESGFADDGWDWCRRPGATTRFIPAQRMLEMDQLGQKLNRPFGPSSFAGGVSLTGRHGLFAMQYAEVGCDQRQQPLEAAKSVFFFNDQIVVLTSGIRHGDGRFPVGTTLYQTHLPRLDTPTWIRDRRQVGPDHEECFSDGRPLTLVDSVGNGYYIPSAQNVVVRRRTQHSLDYSATSETVGQFATAWFDHGLDPQNAGCEYVILVRTEPSELAQFAATADEHYRVLRKDATGHIVTHHKLGLTGYALFEASDTLEQGIVAGVDTPCMVMTQDESGPLMRVSLCNPDLGWEYGKQYAYREKDRPAAAPATARPMPVRVTLRGTWQLHTDHDEVEVHATEGSTIVRVDCSDARSIEFALQRSP